jgi:hypothetical protein
MVNRKLFMSALAGLALLAGTFVQQASATTLAQWTFETSLPTTAGPHLAEGGLFAASSEALGGTGGVYSNPVGNGTAESFSSTLWDLGDYYQFKTSSLGYQGLSLTFDAISSSTGPRDFKVQASTDGSLFTDIGFTYQNRVNSSPAWTSGSNSGLDTFTTSLPSSLDNQANIWVRLVQNSTTSASGGTVATSGTSRVDTVTIDGTEVPEPATCLLMLVGMAGMISRRRL